MVNRAIVMILLTVMFQLYSLEQKPVYYDVEPFAFSYNENKVYLMGDAEPVLQKLGRPDELMELDHNNSITGFSEIAIRYGEYFWISYSPESGNILDLSTNNPDVGWSGIYPIGMSLTELLNILPYRFTYQNSDGFYHYVDLDEYYLNVSGVEREVIGNLQFVLVTENDIITRMYMTFSEYAP
ncbi:MAG: hypothetical protein PQJ59_08105 [Spirochaetales bacterium]|nr:hypothetical protein [Spirochaetales bacterium]